MSFPTMTYRTASTVSLMSYSVDTCIKKTFAAYVDRLQRGVLTFREINTLVFQIAHHTMDAAMCVSPDLNLEVVPVE